jgi:hypothetical protein
MKKFLCKLSSVLPLFIIVALTGCQSTPSTPPAQINVIEAVGNIPIIWGATARPAPLPPLQHASLLVPVTIAGLDTTRLHMQFDLGHPSTVIYQQKWADIAKRLNQAPDLKRIPSLSLKIGSLNMTANDVGVISYPGGGIDWSSDKVEVVGTIGADFIDGRVVVLDFKRNIITLARSRDGVAPSNLRYQPFSFQGRRILLPATFDGNEVRIMYDTGSSAFAWLTNESTFTRLARKETSPISYPIRSWDKMLTAHTVATDAQVKIGDVTFPIGELSRIEGMGVMQEAAISIMGIGGMVGNKLFLGRTVIIDVAKREFAISD